MTRKISFTSCAFIAQLILASPVLAQDSATYDWKHGTMLTGLAGGAFASSADPRVTLGGGFGWELNHWVTIEGSGAWLVPRHEDQGFSADLMALVNLTRPARVVPFVGAGMGLYIASFDMTAGPIPEFYRTRIPQDSAATNRTFTDPMFAFSAGIDIVALEHWSIRPAVNVKLVTDGSSAYVVTIAAVSIGYHFERHDIGR